jgi:hypothetical protein
MPCTSMNQAKHAVVPTHRTSILSACSHPTLPREPIRGHVTFDDVTSGSHVVMRNGTFCTTTIVRKKRGNRLRRFR